MKRLIGRIDSQERNVHIWGAGFSGLVLGYFLKDQGYKVTIYERSNKIGGKIQSKKMTLGLVEKGPNALYLNADGLDLLKDLKLEPIPASKKIKGLVMINGKPRRPFQLGLFSKMSVNVRKKPPLISEGLTVAEFFRPLIGQENINKVLSPALGGIYATPAEHLHFKSIFQDVSNVAQFDSYWDFIKIMMKTKKAAAKAELSGSVTFEGGLQTLINRLSEVLKHDIKLNSKEHLRLKGNTIICTDALNAADLLKELRPEFSAELRRIKYQDLNSVTVFLKREIKSLSKAFGVVIPLESGFHSIGVVNNKAIFPANYENVLSYTFIGRKKCTDQEILEDLRALSSDLTADDIDHIDNNYWERAIPVYDLQRYLSVKKLHQLATAEGNLALFGNYVAGISLREMITAAKAFSRDPNNTLGAT